MKKLINPLIFTIIFLSTFSSSCCDDCEVPCPTCPPTEIDKTATGHLTRTLNKYHNTFDVHTDLDAAGNHFVMKGQMQNAPAMQEGFTGDKYSGNDCIKVTYPGGSSWGGWYFMNGVLQGNQTAPIANWGDYPDAGINLSGTEKLTFYAKGQNGGERVEFFVAGVGRNPDNGSPTHPHPDSNPKISHGYDTLTSDWKEYTIDLRNKNLSYVLGGFGWASNSSGSITFYLDDIKFHKSRLSEPRLIVSYEVENQGTDFDKVMRNCSFIYDDALALIAFLSAGKSTEAKLIADAFVYITQHDRFYSPGHTRNAYMGGDLITPPGWTPNGRANTCRMPGWTDNNNWHEDEFVVSTHTGNAAWMILGLLAYYQSGGAGDASYLNAAKIVGEWINTNCYDTRGAGGFTAGFEGWEPAPVQLLYKSTEHNIDLWAAFQRLYLITGDNKWNQRALHAKNFVHAMYDSAGGKFYTGTTNDGITINTSVIPLDIQPWAIMSLRDTTYLPALEYAENNTKVGVHGYAFSNFDLSTAWMEGTAQMAAVYAMLNQNEKANSILGFIKSLQHQEGALYATQSGTLQTGFDWVYYHRKHVGATAWYVLAEKNVNPFWYGGR